MKLLKALGAVIVGAASILGGFGTFAQWDGIEFGGAAGVVIGAAPAWLPMCKDGRSPASSASKRATGSRITLQSRCSVGTEDGTRSKRNERAASRF